MFKTRFSRPIYFLGLLTLFLSSPVYSFYNELKPIGSGLMKWHFFKLYQASLYAGSDVSPRRYPLALKLSYKRKISSENLVKATQKEWQRMAIEHELTDSWLKKLESLWPDVVPGDEITCFIDADGLAHFYFNSELQGSIENTEFSELFLAIWLSEEARNQKLRQKLLGRGTQS